MRGADLTSQPVRNQCTVPRCTAYVSNTVLGPWNDRWGANSTYTLVTGAVDGPSGTGLTTYARMVTKATGGSKSGLGFHLAANPEAPGAFANGVRTRPGAVHRLSIYVRTSTAITNVQLRVRAGISTGAFSSSGGDGSVYITTVANVWQKISATLTIPADSDRFACYVTMPPVGDGVVLEITGILHTVDQPMPAVYSDGGVPGWVWTGTSGASESVGYPYTLESIAGTPLATLSASGASGALGLATTEGRTLYLVHTVIDTASANSPLASIGPTLAVGAGIAVIRTGAAASTVLEGRLATLTGATAFVTNTGARTVGRHVSALSIAEGAASVAFTVDGLTPVTSAVDPSGGWSTGASNKLNLGASGTSDAPIFAAAYRGEHTLETRRRIIAWLARQYGSPIPAGY